MSRIPNYNVLAQELFRVRERAFDRFWWLEDEIYQTHELVIDLIIFLQSIDELIEMVDFNRAIDIGRRFESLANRLFSLELEIKGAFTSKDTTFTWRGSTTNNIVKAIESEARLYVGYFLPFVSTDPQEDLSTEENDELSLLRTQIRLRVARDGNAERDAVGCTPKHVGTASRPSGQSRNNVPQPTEVSEFYRLQKLKTWQGKSKAEIHREIARRNAKKSKRTPTEAQLMKEAERIKKAVRDYERKVNQQQ